MPLEQVTPLTQIFEVILAHLTQVSTHVATMSQTKEMALAMAPLTRTEWMTPTGAVRLVFFSQECFLAHLTQMTPLTQVEVILIALLSLEPVMAHLTRTWSVPLVIKTTLPTHEAA